MVLRRPAVDEQATRTHEGCRYHEQDAEFGLPLLVGRAGFETFIDAIVEWSANLGTEKRSLWLTRYSLDRLSRDLRGIPLSKESGRWKKLNTYTIHKGHVNGKDLDDRLSEKKTKRASEAAF